MKKFLVFFLAALTVVLCSPASSVNASSHICGYPQCSYDTSCTDYNSPSCHPPIPPTTTSVAPTSSTTTSLPSTTTTSVEPTSSTTTSISSLASLNEDFEGEPFPPADWSSKNILGTYVWQRNTSYHKTGAASAFIDCQTSDSLNELMPAQIDFMPSGGEDWLITPQISVSAGYELKFWFMPSQSNMVLEKLDILVSITDTAGTSFTNSLGSITVSDLYIQWYEYAYSLSSYEGKNIYIAFKHTVTQLSGRSTQLQEQQGIDDPVKITGSPGSGIYLDDVMVSGPSSTTTTSIDATSSTTSVEPATTTIIEQTTTTTMVEPTTTIAPATTTIAPFETSTTTTIVLRDDCLTVIPETVSKQHWPDVAIQGELRERLGAKHLEPAEIIALYKIFKYTIGLQVFTMIGDSDTSFTLRDAPQWNTPGIKTILKIKMGARSMLALVFIDPVTAEAGTYGITIGDCAGSVSLLEP